MTAKDQPRDLFFKALDRLENRDFKNAELLLLQTLDLAPRSIPTLNNLAAAQYEQRKIDEAGATARKVIDIDPRNLDAYLMLAACQKEQNKYEDARKTCESIIAIEPANAEAHSNRGFVLNKIGKYQEALESIDRAIAIQPRLADAFLNRGNALRHLKRYDEALSAYDTSAALKPDMAEARVGRGTIFFSLKRYADAYSAYDKARGLKPDLTDAWLGCGNAAFELRRFDDALAAYAKAFDLDRKSGDAWVGRANVLFELRRRDEAFAAYGKALEFKPDLAEAWLGRGNLLFEIKRYDEARAAYDEALAHNPGLAKAWNGKGDLFRVLNRYGDAIAAYDKALAIEPDLAAVEGARLHAKMHLCDWSNFDAECGRLLSAIRNNKENAAPFALFGISSSPDDQMKCAELWVASRCPAAAKPLWQGERYNHDRVRIAYLSGDFRDHPVSYLMAGVFERHDRDQFETVAVSFGSDDGSELRRRLTGAFDRFIEVQDRSDMDVAQLLRAQEIDIAVDLVGFTQDCRTPILAQRPAPIQVNYLGFPGTMGARYFDYLVADLTIIPVQHQRSYREKIAYLPNNYMPHDELNRTLSERKFARAEFGLPPEGFVFCCFNNSYKLNPHVFDVWMKILQAVQGSVLWLSQTSDDAAANLKKEAVARGIDPARLVFATRVPSRADHLARHGLADLFLDTSPYNAHTTASDALWAGLPLLTKIGETFAGRVSASLLNALGLPELVAQSENEYQAFAIELAMNRSKLAAIKNKIMQHRLSKPLFNTAIFTRHLEQAYLTMHQRHQAGLPPEHFVVPP